LVARIGCLLGGEIALLPFGNLEERVSSGFSLNMHRTFIQVICINVQQWISDNSATIAALFHLKEHRAEEQSQLSNERTGQKNFPAGTIRKDLGSAAEKGRGGAWNYVRRVGPSLR
jgi:hypothetical protein